MSKKKGKLTVCDPGEDTRVPFLRGILTRSLQDAGLMFEEAYPIADEVRERLSDESEIDTTNLRGLVTGLLEERGFEEVAAQYRTPRHERAACYVRARDGHLAPFSKNTLMRSLEVCAESRDSLFAIAAGVERRLLAEGKSEIDTPSLMEITYRALADSVGSKIARRYVRWQEFTDTDRPLILLVGGVTGTGKSTISSLVAHRLGIVRTQSTDMLREVMRRMVPRRLIPSLHESSFTAYRALPRWRAEDGEKVVPRMVDGYLIQAAEVGVGIEGVFRRALSERVSLVMEGVHLHPSVQRSMALNPDAIVVPLMLATMKRKALHRQLQGRGVAIPSRRAERYLDSFDEIWELQTFLLSEADEHDIPIITERDPDDMVRRIMRVIADRLREDFEGDPKAVFAAARTA